MKAPLLAASLLALSSAALAAPAPAAPHYAIEATADTAHGRLELDVAISNVQVQSGAPATFLLGGAFEISNTSASTGAAVTIAPPAGPGAPSTLIVACTTCSDGQLVTVHLHYAGPVADQDGSNIVAADRIELSADSLWYPISTNFNTRVLFDMRLHGLNRDFVIASPDEARRSGSDVLIHRIMPSQDIAFTAAPHLREIDDGELHFYATDFSDPLTRQYLRNGPRALAFLERLYGRLPTHRAVVSIIDRTGGVGYSRPGYVAVSRATGAHLADDIWASTGYLAHELSHAWWSNADFTGEDYWLVESTAEYSALRFIEFVHGRAERDRLLTAKQPRADRSGPILGHGRPSNDAVYGKGPILLFALEARIGRPKLERILGALARQPAITTADFLAELTRVASQQDADWFAGQLRT